MHSVVVLRQCTCSDKPQRTHTKYSTATRGWSTGIEQPDQCFQVQFASRYSKHNAEHRTRMLTARTYSICICFSPMPARCTHHSVGWYNKILSQQATSWHQSCYSIFKYLRTFSQVSISGRMGSSPSKSYWTKTDTFSHAVSATKCPDLKCR